MLVAFSSLLTKKNILGDVLCYEENFRIDSYDSIIQHYKQAGSGNFAKWQEHITDWHRNIYDMPSVFQETSLYNQPKIDEDHHTSCLGG
uniref:Uncharacterized protein n=1 Tax=Marinomonas sp. (strain MWYL1) TaxID=400668 RepID=A6W031_MARMS